MEEMFWSARDPMAACITGMLITMSDMGSGGPVAGPAHGMHVYGPRGLSVLTTALGTFVNTREIGLQVLLQRRHRSTNIGWSVCSARRREVCCLPAREEVHAALGHVMSLSSLPLYMSDMLMLQLR